MECMQREKVAEPWSTQNLKVGNVDRDRKRTLLGSTSELEGKPREYFSQNIESKLFLQSDFVRASQNDEQDTVPASQGARRLDKKRKDYSWVGETIREVRGECCGICSLIKFAYRVKGGQRMFHTRYDILVRFLRKDRYFLGKEAEIETHTCTKASFWEHPGSLRHQMQSQITVDEAQELVLSQFGKTPMQHTNRLGFYPGSNEQRAKYNKHIYVWIKCTKHRSSLIKKP